jgi:MFS family permease
LQKWQVFNSCRFKMAFPASEVQLTTIRSNQDEETSTPATASSNDLHPTTPRRQVLVLISSFLTICITIGLNQSYGVFQSYYTSASQTMLPKSTSSSALTAFIGTLGSGLTWSGSLLINPILARLNIRGTKLLCVLGVLCMSLGLGLASLCTRVWQLLLTQGLLYGMGSSLLYFPILSVAPEYFTAHRGSAMGFILSGAGIGGLVFSPLIRALISSIGPRWTLRALAVFVLVASLPIAATAAPSRFVGRRQTHINVKLAMKPSFLFSVGAGFLQAGGNGLPLTFLAEYSVVLGYSAGLGATLLAVSNGVNSVSRVMTGFAGDKFGRQNTLILTVVLCVISVLGFWLRSVKGGNKALWIVFVVLYGITGGGYNALFPTVSLLTRLVFTLLMEVDGCRSLWPPSVC